VRDSINLEELMGYGFDADTGNCEEGDHYYSTNNWFCQIHEEFRIVINEHSRFIEMFYRCEDAQYAMVAHNTDNLTVLLDMLVGGLIEVVEVS
jgi:hypothetical protein